MKDLSYRFLHHEHHTVHIRSKLLLQLTRLTFSGKYPMIVPSRHQDDESSFDR